jgi:hypothetical protein
MVAFLWNEAWGWTFCVGTLYQPTRLARRARRKTMEQIMADRTSLEILGFIFGGVTAIVIAIAAVVVQSHIRTNLAVEQSAPVIPVALSPRR